MNVIVAVIGWIIVAEGLLGIARPHLMLTAVLSWPPDLRFYVAIGRRIIIGLLLVWRHRIVVCRASRGRLASLPSWPVLFTALLGRDALTQFFNGCPPNQIGSSNCCMD